MAPFELFFFSPATHTNLRLSISILLVLDNVPRVIFALHPAPDISHLFIVSCAVLLPAGPVNGDREADFLAAWMAG